MYRGPQTANRQSSKLKMNKIVYASSFRPGAQIWASLLKARKCTSLWTEIYIILRGFVFHHKNQHSNTWNHVSECSSETPLSFLGCILHRISSIWGAFCTSVICSCRKFSNGYWEWQGWGILCVCMTVFYTQARWATLAGATIFVLAAITDWLDGYLARRVIYPLDFSVFLGYHLVGPTLDLETWYYV